MTKIFDASILTQLLFSLLFIIHRFFYPFGSDFMFGVLIFSLIISGYLFWQIFKVGNIFGLRKILGIICASLPIIWLMLLVGFLY